MTGHTGPVCTSAHRGAKPPQVASRRDGEVVVTQRLKPTDPRGQSVRPSTGRSDTGGSSLDQDRNARLS
eukprot:5149158-Pyramimonas_sp.AAC.1